MGERNCPRCGSAVPEGDPCRCADTAAPTGPGESPPAAGSDAADPDATETDTTDAEAADPGAPPRQVTPDHPAQLPTADPRDWDDALFAEHTLLLGHGERLQRVYPLVQRRRFRGAVEAQIMLTDARLLYRARARSPLRRSTVNREIELSQVRGSACIKVAGSRSAPCCRCSSSSW